MFEAEGIFTALVTSFARDGALDLDSIRESVRFQVAAGVRGVCALGGTGEPLAQTIDEQKQVIECVVAEADGGIGVIVGCLNASQPDIIEIGKHAKAAGADAIMVLPPYFVMATPHHVKRHLIDVAAAVDLPMILFNTPRRAGVDLEVAFILELLDAIPHLVAIKEASGDMHAVTQLAHLAPGRFSVLQGFDELILPTLAVGGRGAIISGACLAPRLFVELCNAFRAGDVAHARALQHAIMPLCRAIYAEPNPAPLKQALAMVGRSAGPTRPPLYDIQDETTAALRTALGELGPWLGNANTGPALRRKV